MERLAGKVALITGGSRGQGAAEGHLFAEEGATVCLTDVLVDEGQATAAKCGGTFYEHDVTDADAWATITADIAAAHGKIDILVNNAGIFRLGGVTSTDRELWDSTIAINQTGVFLGMQAVAPVMTDNKSGSIINISSIAGIRGAGMALAYGATKWAVRGMTKSAAQELASQGVRVNSIHPGIIDTPMLQTFDSAGLREQVQSRIPLGYEASADDVANMALFLASDDSSYCTGSEFIVDGGMTA
jgi:NAD(P)-dependent dehydrogenase (short-subunit alcohol dehydrogenase family)